MDRGLLSDVRLLDASRDFVCVRLVTYEDHDESAFLQTLGGSATGAVLNTTFVMLAPDGVTPLCRAGRSPAMSFRGERDPTQALLDRMKEIVERFPGNDAPRHEHLPALVDVRRALNVASSDNQPLVVISVEDPATRAEVAATLTPLAWSPEFRGRFAFVQATSADDLALVHSASTADQVFVVQPDLFGLEGDILTATDHLDTESLRALLERGRQKYAPHDKSRSALLRGMRTGVEWKAESLEFRTPDPDQARRPKRGDRTRRGARGGDGG